MLLTSQSSEGPGASLKEPARLETLLLASAKLSSSLWALPARAGARAMKDGEEGSCPASKNSSPSLSTTPAHGQEMHFINVLEDRPTIDEQPPVMQTRFGTLGCSQAHHGGMPRAMMTMLRSPST